MILKIRHRNSEPQYLVTAGREHSLRLCLVSFTAYGGSRPFSVIAQGFDSGAALERVRHYTSLKIDDRDSAVAVICDESRPAVRSESESHRGSTGVHHKLLAMEVRHP